jgi:hypothetical protein
MIAVFGHDEVYRRYLHLLSALVTAGDGNIRWDICSTVPTHSGSMVYNFGRVKKVPSMPFGSFLLARFSTCWGSERGVSPKGAALGKSGRVGGVEPQIPSQLGIICSVVKVTCIKYSKHQLV